MSNFAYRSQFSYSYAGQLVQLMAKVSIGASGAPTIVSGTGMGIASVVRVSAGLYTINLTNTFATLQGVDVSIRSAGAPAAPSMNIVLDSVAVSAAPLVRIQMRDIAAAAADPASGEVLYLTLTMNRSSTGC